MTTNSDDLAEKARLLRGHGAKSKYFHKVVGGNFRIDPLQTALLGVKLPHLAEYTAGRQKNAARYSSELSKIPGVCANPADSICSASAPAADACKPKRCGIVLPAAYPHNHHIWNQYTLRVIAGGDWTGSENPRDGLKNFLTSRDIGSEIYYPQPMHLQECFAVAGQAPAKLPVAERLAAECLSIPVFPDLSLEQQDAVIGAIRDFMGTNA